MEQHKIDRINELAKKHKAEGLTAEEAEERALLRAEYVASFRENLAAQLENTYIVDERGNKQKLKKKADNKQA